MFFVEIHVNRHLVDLRHTVLKSSLDAEFVELDGQHEIRQNRFRDFDPEEPNHGAHGSRDNRGGASHTETVRNVRLIAKREVVIGKHDMLFHTVSIECLHTGFEQTDTSVVAELGDA